MKICIVLGTRPEIIKMAPIIRECQIRHLDFFVLHTGQHYSANMDQDFFGELGLPAPKYNLKIGSRPHREQLGLMVRAISGVLSEEKPTVVIVQGDTTSVLAGALAASKLGIRLVHHEAGLRSNDLAMLEETNRITTDHVADLLCAPTLTAVSNLYEEGCRPTEVFYTGNTIVDAVTQNTRIAETSTHIISELGLAPRHYIFVTAHRAENVDRSDRLANIMQGLGLVANDLGLLLIFAVHPRTKQRLQEFAIACPPGVSLIDPVGYLSSLALQANAALVITDSGGIQEESCILRVPCVTIRDNTERPETIEIGANVLVGTDPKQMLCGAQQMVNVVRDWSNPFGDGRAAEKIIGLVLQGCLYPVDIAQ